MKKFLFTFIIIILIVTVGIYFISGMIFNVAAKKMISQLKPHLANQGISINDYNYKYIRFSSLRTITVYDLYSIIEINLPQQNNDIYTSYFNAEKINFHLENLKKTAVNVSCSDFNLYVEQLKDIPGTSFARIDQGYVKLGQPIVLSRPLTGLKNIFQNITNLFDEKELSPNLTMRALVTIKLGNKNSQAHLYTVQEGGQTTLQFRHEDIKHMADTLALELSDEETAIIARYPLRTTPIMRITLDAKDTSRKAKKQDRSLPKDAYRHVLWSYLLTQEFGPAFAQKVTDAHETLPTNTTAQRKMDFHNNRIGRDYALQGVSRDRIVWLVKNDKNIIKFPKEVR